MPYFYRRRVRESTILVTVLPELIPSLFRSEYDQTLYEDEVTNRIDEASTLWDSVSNSRWFAQSSLVLFLNKTDLFKAKLRVSPLQHYMPQYQGDGDWQSASAFMLQHFTSLLKNPNKRLYSHFTCATDKEQIRFVLSALQDFIIKTNLAATVRIATTEYSLHSDERL